MYRMSFASHESHHTEFVSHMSVIPVGLRQSCGELDTAFLVSLRQNASARSPHPRLRIRAVRGDALLPRLLLGNLREEDFHLGSSPPGLRCVGSRRRAFGHPGAGETTT